MILNPKQIKKILKEDMADETTRKNVKRFFVDVGVSNALVILALLLARANDDDEDVSLAMGYADYILTRVSNEQLSASVALPQQIGNFIESPLMIYTKAEDMIFDSVDLITGDDTIARGGYAGYTVREKYLIKNLPFLKEYKRLKDPIRERQTYSFFNFEKDDTLDKFAWLSFVVDEEGNEEE